MKEIPLREFANEKGQSEAGRLLGVSAPAINKALSSGREITVIDHGDGSFSAKELRSFPSQQPKQSVA